MENKNYEDWKAVFTTNLDYEAELVSDRLRDAGIPSVVMSKRDHAYNLTLGDMADVRVMVPSDHLEAARELLATAPLSDAELEEAALAADPFDDTPIPEVDDDEEESDA